VSRFDLEPATIRDLFYWINERHLIWCRRRDGVPPPWTKDEILQTWKFTNVFRELDRGTIALRKMIPDAPDELVLFNIVWYRMLNWVEHAEDPGFVYALPALTERLREKKRAGEKLFTSAHMTVGRTGEDKIETMIRSFEDIWLCKEDLCDDLLQEGTLENAFRSVQQFYGIGPFIAYEIACDLRFHLLQEAPDILTWANIGPGCKRGLQRLGMPVHLDSLKELWERAPHELRPHLFPHYPGEGRLINVPTRYPPFELREIEHSLCEFDKYMRVKTGAGHPREYFNARAELPLP